MTEIWKDIKGYEGLYQVSNLGNVKSLSYRNHTSFSERELILKPWCLKGYKGISLTRNNKPRRRLLHRLVAQAFIPNPENKPEVNHKDFDHGNNYVENLEWMTHLENICHAAKGGRFPDRRGIKNCKVKLTEKQVHQIRSIWKNHKSNNTQSDIGRMFNVSKNHVYNILVRKYWQHI
jgi:hypothetical protein